jgi:hypothetical protein
MAFTALLRTATVAVNRNELRERDSRIVFASVTVR